MSSLTQKSVPGEALTPRLRYSPDDRTRFLDVLDRTGKVSAASAETGFNLSKCYAWARQTRANTPAAKTGSTRGTIKTKYTQSQKDEFFFVLDRVGSVSAAAKTMGFPVGTCFQWSYAAGVATRRPGHGKRGEYLRLRAAGSSRRAAAAEVGVHSRTAEDWDKGISKIGSRRVYPDGRVIDYKQGVTTFTDPAAPPAPAPSPGLVQLQKPISSRYLSLPEREQIRDLRREGNSLRSIARALGRPASSISRELARNTGPAGYQPYAAHRTAASRRPRPKPSKLALKGDLRDFVRQGLLVCWSPEQISNRLLTEFPDSPEMRVAPETIYQSLYFQARGGLKREVQTALRSGRTRRKARTDPQKRTSRFRDPMINISERPPEVEDRAVPGHWEGDLITGALNQTAIATLVERTTRYVMLVHLDGDHTAETVRDGLIKTMVTLPAHLRGSLTWDQGAEMASHKAFSIATDMDVYFCDPASPWQRGSNENTNGLLRQYFPKGSDLSVHSVEDLEHVAQQLNGRPRKTLGWETPAERMRDLLLTT